MDGSSSTSHAEESRAPFLGASSEGSILGIGDDQRYAHSEFGARLVLAPSMQLAAWNFTGGARG